jgi:hypothetical protein
MFENKSSFTPANPPDNSIVLALATSGGTTDTGLVSPKVPKASRINVRYH